MNPKRLVLVVFMVVLVASLGLHFLVPAPPRKLVMTTGSPSGKYYKIAQEYKKHFAQNGIELEIRTSAGSIENVEKLNDLKSDVSLGFVQTGTSDSTQSPNVETLAGIAYEPLWVIYQPSAFKALGRFPESVSDLRGHTVSIGAQGSGTKKLAEAVIAIDGKDKEQIVIKTLNGDDSYQALDNGEIDGFFINAGPDAQIMQKIFQHPKMQLMSFSRAYGYPPKIPGLEVLQIHRSTFDIPTDTPNRDITVISPTTEIVAKKNIHPALVSLLMDITSELMSGPTVLNAEKTFPNNSHASFEVNEDADKYIRNGPSFLHRYLPFWAAVWVDRILRIGLPLLALLLPAFNFLPTVLNYHKNLKLSVIYTELKNIERDMELQRNLDQLKDRLNTIDRKASAIKVSKFNIKDVYELRSYIIDVRERLVNDPFVQ